MHEQDGAPIRFVGIARHGVIGNRRTAAMVAADGTIDARSGAFRMAGAARRHRVV